MKLGDRRGHRHEHAHEQDHGGPDDVAAERGTCEVSRRYAPEHQRVDEPHAHLRELRGDHRGPNGGQPNELGEGRRGRSISAAVLCRCAHVSDVRVCPRASCALKVRDDVHRVGDVDEAARRAAA